MTYVYLGLEDGVVGLHQHQLVMPTINLEARNLLTRIKRRPLSRITRYFGVFIFRHVIHYHFTTLYSVSSRGCTSEVGRSGII